MDDHISFRQVLHLSGFRIQFVDFAVAPFHLVNPLDRDLGQDENASPASFVLSTILKCSSLAAISMASPQASTAGNVSAFSFATADARISASICFSSV
jgi:hypothetical protein